jgi:succinoglycan biosynthesis transport protein ExoP
MKFSRYDLLSGLSALRSIRVRLVRRRRWAIGSALIIAGVTAAAFFMAPRSYVATGSVSLDNRTAAARRAAPSGTEAARARQAELGILASAQIAGQVVDTLGLARKVGFGLYDDDDTVAPADARARAVRQVTDGLKTDPQGASNVARLHYGAEDPRLAAAIVNRTLERYVAARRVDLAAEPAPDRDKLRKRIERAREAVIRADAAIAAVRSAGAPPTALPPATRSAAAPVRRNTSSIAAQLRDAEREEAALARKRWIARTARGGDRSDASAAEEAQLRAERADLVQRLGSVHPDVAVVDARLAELARERRNGSAAVAAMTEQLGVLRQRIADLRANRQSAAATTPLPQVAPSEVSADRIAALRKKADKARDRYAALLTRQQRADAAQLAAQNGAFIVARATIPVVPASPRGWRYLLAGLAAALVAEIAVAFGEDIVARGFRSRAHAERALGIPVIGMVPDLNREPADGGDKAARVDPADYLFFDSRSPFTAAFRAIHTGLRLGSAAHSPRSVAVSSALPDEGKTTVAVCLARSAALAGLRVVLIDCDVRHPAATRALAAHVSVGLIEVLRDGAALKDALLRDTPSGAWILGHTATGGEGSEDLISSRAMADLIVALAPDFDLIVLDTPPALALDEARGVSAMADCVLLVARWHKTPVDATRSALEQLTRAGANVVAAALTLVGR